MTIGPLLIAVRDRLRDVSLRLESFTVDPKQIEIMPDEKPKSNAGQSFISVYAHKWNNANPDAQGALDESMGVCCVLSCRTPEHPQDREGHIYAEMTNSMSTICYFIAGAIHQWEGIHAATDDQIAAVEQIAEDSSDLRGLYNHLVWSHTDPMPKKVPPDHFMQMGEHQGGYEGMVAGFMMKVVFQGAERSSTTSRLAELVT